MAYLDYDCNLGRFVDGKHKTAKAWEHAILAAKARQARDPAHT
jgi:hypothetical protein